MLRSLFEMIARTCENLKDRKICTIKHEKLNKTAFIAKRLIPIILLDVSKSVAIEMFQNQEKLWQMNWEKHK